MGYFVSILTGTSLRGRRKPTVPPSLITNPRKPDPGGIEGLCNQRQGLGGYIIHNLSLQEVINNHDQCYLFYNLTSNPTKKDLGNVVLL